MDGTWLSTPPSSSLLLGQLPGAQVRLQGLLLLGTEQNLPGQAHMAMPMWQFLLVFLSFLTSGQGLGGGLAQCHPELYGPWPAVWETKTEQLSMPQQNYFLGLTTKGQTAVAQRALGNARQLGTNGETQLTRLQDDQMCLRTSLIWNLLFKIRNLDLSCSFPLYQSE